MVVSCCPGAAADTGSFGYRRIGDQWNGVDQRLCWFSPHTRSPGNEFVHGLNVQELQVKRFPERKRRRAILKLRDRQRGAPLKVLAPLAVRRKAAVGDFVPLVYQVVIAFKKTETILAAKYRVVSWAARVPLISLA
jgi:hypothetical protein